MCNPVRRTEAPRITWSLLATDVLLDGSNLTREFVFESWEDARSCGSDMWRPWTTFVLRVTSEPVILPAVNTTRTDYSDLSDEEFLALCVAGGRAAFGVGSR